MKIYIMLPFGIIEPIRSADAYSGVYQFCGGLTGDLTPDYAIFFKAPYKYKFKKASMDSNNCKDANANLGDNGNSWTYTIIDPETFDLY